MRKLIHRLKKPFDRLVAIGTILLIALLLAGQVIDLPFGQRNLERYRITYTRIDEHTQKVEAVIYRNTLKNLYSNQGDSKYLAGQVIALPIPNKKIKTNPLLGLIQLKESFFQRKICLHSEIFHSTDSKTIFHGTGGVSLNVEREGFEKEQLYDIREFGSLTNDGRCLVLEEEVFSSIDSDSEIPIEIIANPEIKPTNYTYNLAIIEGEIRLELVNGFVPVSFLYLGIFGLVIAAFNQFFIFIKNLSEI